MLYLVGIGYSKEDIGVGSVKIVSQCCEVYLEYYTSFYSSSIEELEGLFKNKIICSDRKFIEEKIEDVILRAKNLDIAILVIGDPLIATTHTDLILRAMDLGVELKVINCVSVLNLIGKTGLQLYKFGKIISIPFYSEKFLPRTPFLSYLANAKIGAHSLFLLDLNPFKQDVCKNEEFLSVEKAIGYFFKVQPFIKDEFADFEFYDESLFLKNDSKVVVCSRLGFNDERIFFGKIREILSNSKILNLKPPLSIIVPSDMHELEREFLEKFYKI